MGYDEDLEKSDNPISFLTNEDALRVLIMILTMLLIIIGLPSLFSGVYENPLPAIIMLGFVTVILSILYLASKVDNLVRM